MSKYHFTNVSETELFVYSFAADKEFKLTSFGYRVRSPVFLDKKIIFIVERKNITGTFSYLYGVKYLQRDNIFHYANATYVSLKLFKIKGNLFSLFIIKLSTKFSGLPDVFWELGEFVEI